MKSILDRSFRYTPSAQTDLKKTFARVRREQRVLDHEVLAVAAETKLKVAPLRRGTRSELLKQVAPGKL